MRKLPETKQEWEKIKASFLKMKDVEDIPETWTFILSQLQGVKMPELEFDPKIIWAHYKRWKIAKVLQDEKTVYIAELQAKLKKLMEEQGDGTSVHAGASDLKGELPGLSSPEERMEPSPP